MSLSIFDVDEMSIKSIEGNEIKIVSKYCGSKAKPPLEVETGWAKVYDENAAIVFNLRDVFSGANWTIKADKDDYGLELIFRGRESCEAFHQALEFAVNVLKEAKDRALFQDKERAF